MKENKVKICEVCQDSFIPDPRVGDRQRVCKKLICQRERKYRSQQDWVKRNPGYFKGRYPELKEKILKRQRLLRSSPRQMFCPSQKESVTIQDELIKNNNSILTAFLETFDIQDEITSKIIEVNQHLHKLKAILYKPNEPIVFS